MTTGNRLGGYGKGKGNPETQRRRRNQRANAARTVWFQVFRSRMLAGMEICRNRDCSRLAETFGHIVAHARGGPFNSGNVALLCVPCNTEQGDVTWPWRNSTSAWWTRRRRKTVGDTVTEVWDSKGRPIIGEYGRRSRSHMADLAVAHLHYQIQVATEQLAEMERDPSAWRIQARRGSRRVSLAPED